MPAPPIVGMNRPAVDVAPPAVEPPHYRPDNTPGRLGDEHVGRALRHGAGPARRCRSGSGSAGLAPQQQNRFGLVGSAPADCDFSTRSHQGKHLRRQRSRAGRLPEVEDVECFLLLERDAEFVIDGQPLPDRLARRASGPTKANNRSNFRRLLGYLARLTAGAEGLCRRSTTLKTPPVLSERTTPGKARFQSRYSKMSGAWVRSKPRAATSSRPDRHTPTRVETRRGEAARRQSPGTSG